MTIKPPYLLDSNTLMEAARRYYQFGFARPFWDGLVGYAKKGVLFSIDKVFDEIDEGDDLLKQWATTDFFDYFMDSQTSQVIQPYADLMTWAEGQTQYRQKAKDVFMEDKNADAWIIAFAMAHKCTLVTHEIGRPAKQKNIPIPNVCDAFGQVHCNTFFMLEKLGFKFLK